MILFRRYLVTESHWIEPLECLNGVFYLQPRKRIEERFLSELPENTKSAEVEVKVTMFPTPQMELLIHRVMKKLDFEK
jgi:hypothetical protein